MTPDQIDTVRAFHRLVTQRAGALEDRFLGRMRPLGQSRVLYEIGNTGASLRTLRTVLGLDSGYLSRLVHALVSEGLVILEPLPGDERVVSARLTRAGLEEWDEINRRSDLVAEEVLGPLSAGQRERLRVSMSETVRLLKLSALRFRSVDATADEARGALGKYFAELGERFEEGFDPKLSPAPDRADFAPPRGAFLTATVYGEVVACGGVTRLDEGIAYIKRMWVDHSMRGLGLGRRLLAELEDAARELDCTTVRLETNQALVEAIALYRSAGYGEIPRFVDEPYAHHWFEKRLSDHQGSR